MKIVAIGGGEIERPGYPIETEEIDREIIRLSGKKHPKVLFIPTARPLPPEIFIRSHIIAIVYSPSPTFERACAIM